MTPKHLRHRGDSLPAQLPPRLQSVSSLLLLHSWRTEEAKAGFRRAEVGLRIEARISGEGLRTLPIPSFYEEIGTGRILLGPLVWVDTAALIRMVTATLRPEDSCSSDAGKERAGAGDGRSHSRVPGQEGRGHICAWRTTLWLLCEDGQGEVRLGQEASDCMTNREV